MKFGWFSFIKSKPCKIWTTWITIILIIFKRQTNQCRNKLHTITTMKQTEWVNLKITTWITSLETFLEKGGNQSLFN